MSGGEARYSQRYDNQEARHFDKMGRHYYVAGEKIDGAVIQHYPGSEILVVDFEKGDHLREFYDSAIQKYQKLSWVNKLQMSLPVFLQAEVQQKVKDNKNISDAVCDGSLASMMNDKAWLDKLDPAISKSGLREIAQEGALSNKKIGVGTYLRIGTGVCRQQGVILAACLERAITQGKAPGWRGVEIRANIGHLWVVAKDKGGKVSVFDPAQKYYGSAERGRWNYHLGYEKHVFGVPD